MITDYHILFQAKFSRPGPFVCRAPPSGHIFNVFFFFRFRKWVIEIVLRLLCRLSRFLLAYYYIILNAKLRRLSYDDKHCLQLVFVLSNDYIPLRLTRNAAVPVF